jgi:hypothetical protein
MEWAFTAPALLKERLGGEPLDATRIARMDPAALEAVFRDKPALHRYPGSMAKRTQAVCAYLVEHYGGRAEALWSDVASGDELLARVVALPGFGEARRASSSDCSASVSTCALPVGRSQRRTGRRSPTSTPSSACSRSARRSAR